MTEPILYQAPAPGPGEPCVLVAVGGPCDGRRYTFHDALRIGRLVPGTAVAGGTLAIADPTVSAEHCVVSRDSLGRCFVRDLSRNGTRLDDRRLVPGVEFEMRTGQTLTIGQGASFRLELPPAPAPAAAGAMLTAPLPSETVATIVVGDLCGYTTMVRTAPGEALQASVTGLFAALEEQVAALGGTVKEYPGDALLAWWEDDAAERCAVRACRAALALHQAARRLADDGAVWQVPGAPPRMEWALATGSVLIDRRGAARPQGLSMVGEPVVLAYRIEKVAGADTGPILACAATRGLAEDRFVFRDLGPRRLDGFAAPQPVFALERAR